MDPVHLYTHPQIPPYRVEEKILVRLLRPVMTVLDLGCGDGRITRQLLGQGIRVWACDPSGTALHRLKRSLAVPETMVLFQADARSLPLQDGSLDGHGTGCH